MYSSSDSGHGDLIYDEPVRGTDRISNLISRSDVALVRKSQIMLRCMNPIQLPGEISQANYYVLLLYIIG